MVRKSARNAAAVVKEKEEVVDTTTVATKVTGTRGKKSTAIAKTEVEVVKKKVAAVAKPSTKRKAAAAVKDEAESDDDERCKHDDEDEPEAKKPPPKKRKTKAEKEAEDMVPLAARTAVSSLKKAMYIGAHVSGAGGVHNSIQNAHNIGANSFALFLKSQRKWTSPPMADEHRDAFHAKLKQLGYDAAEHILPHGSYLVNLAQSDKTKADQSYNNFVDDLKRCEALGIKLYNFHPGSTGGESMEAACARIAQQLNRSHKATKTVITVLENMCGSGNIVGSKFEELRDIISQVDDKSRVGVCLDTCHAFAAGHDLREPKAFEETVAKFDEIVGLKYLKAFHLNDSKAPFGSHRDLHANIGTGFLGLRAFHNIMNHAPFQNLPMVLETPIDEKGADGKTVENHQIWADEIKLLESLIGMDVESEHFKKRSEELQKKGAGERKKIQEQVDKKAKEDAKKAAKAAAKAEKGTGNPFTKAKRLAAKKKKKVETDEEDNDSE
ncbi:xylose isomerase-like protein [Diplogelasinospora grovesii]|uniref:Apurinic-apyrimidinic endonuclease 1 n=1 Tax=Diplogelasinospora grovesii TaxID=303347 RepID=A0AAN6NAQ0_9PEZI|nr:xylose isomerase-like protein [Diplogelasinospora grovesii]